MVVWQRKGGEGIRITMICQTSDGGVFRADVVTDNVKSASDTAAAKGAERQRPSAEASEARRLAHRLGDRAPEELGSNRVVLLVDERVGLGLLRDGAPEELRADGVVLLVDVGGGSGGGDVLGGGDGDGSHFEESLGGLERKWR